MTPSRQITIHFALSLEDGSVIDSTFAGSPATFTPGDGSLLPAFEACVLSMSAGERRVHRLLPDEAFGSRKTDNLLKVDRRRFDPAVELMPGLVLSFGDSRGHERPGIVTSIAEDVVEIDFNHPLAGKTVLFDVELLSVADNRGVTC